MTPRERLIDYLRAHVWELPDFTAEEVADAIDRADHNLHRVSLIVTLYAVGLGFAVTVLTKAGYIDEPKAEGVVGA